ncbi:hypothetical protein LY474_39420 [Myxococcus stipitatus]|nr:hypothetical protein [Myxococcus stipitatus]MCE9673883.1 hypothetical protein [Myxococcus stipitatus]
MQHLDPIRNARREHGTRSAEFNSSAVLPVINKEWKNLKTAIRKPVR